MKRISRRTLLGTAAACALSAPAVRAQKADMGVALVIGNSRYLKEAALPNPKRDTTDVAARFRAKSQLLLIYRMVVQRPLMLRWGPLQVANN